MTPDGAMRSLDLAEDEGAGSIGRKIEVIMQDLRDQVSLYCSSCSVRAALLTSNIGR